MPTWMRLRPYSLLLLLLLDDLMMMLECSLRFAEAASNSMAPSSSQCLLRSVEAAPTLCGAVFLCGALAMPCQVRPLACPLHAFLGGALDCAPSTPFTDLCLAGTCLSHSTIALRESRWCSSDCVLGLELAPTCASLALTSSPRCSTVALLRGTFS